MTATTLLSWAVWALILVSIDPETAGAIGHSAFFVTLFFAFTGTVALIGLIVRMRLVHDPLLHRQIGTSFRQGLLLSLLFVGALLLQTTGFLTWWNLGAYLLLLACVEFFFLAREYKSY